MSLIFMDSFDDGLQNTKWTFFGEVTSSSTVRTGPRSVNMNGTSDIYQALGTNKHATIITGFAFNGLEPPNAGRRQWRFKGDAGTTTHIALMRNSSAGIDVYRGGTFGDVLLDVSPVNVVPANTWVYIETKVVLADAGGSVVVRVNGAQVINFSGDTRNGGADPTIDRVAWGTETGDADGYFMDDLYICNGAGAVNNDFLGDCKIYAVYPDGNGNYSQGVNSAATSVNNYSYVDENPDPNTSDYVAFATTGDKDTYTFGDIPGGTIFGVQQAMYAAKSDSGSRTMRNIQRIAGVDYSSAVDQALSSTPAYAGKFDLMEVSPATSVAWTVSEVNGAEFGTEARP